MAAPLRVAGLNQVGREKTPAQEAFDNIDPNRGVRSLAMPFIPLSGERARMQANLSDQFEKASTLPSELGEFSKLVDKYGMERASKMAEEDQAAGLAIKESLSSLQGEDKSFDDVVERFYAIKNGSDSGGSGGGSTPAWMGGSTKKVRPAKKPAWMR
jgi:hypothetical protein